MDGKSPLTSKTLWINLIAVLALLGQGYAGFVIGPEYQAAILAVVNLILRIVTKQAIDWKTVKNQNGRAVVPLLPLLIGVVLIVALLAGCAGSTLGDGQVDEVEAATIQVAVGLAMNAAPETVAPAYAVSTALLTVMDGDDPVGLDLLNSKVTDKIAELELTDAERQSVNELVSLVRAKIKEQLNLTDATENQRLIVVKTVLEIVRDAAAARLGVSVEWPDLEWPDAVAAIDWEQFDRDVDQAIATAALATDAKLGLTINN